MTASPDESAATVRMKLHSSNKNGQPTLSRLELRCPPLPQTLVEALELVEQPDQLEVKPVTAMVERDPVVVARLLQTVNSAYYGLRRTISAVERAVVLLGPVAVTGIVVGMNMLKLRSVLDGPAASCFTRLIRHSTATAFLTRHIYERIVGPIGSDAVAQVGDSFTAGLLHDFGKIILVYNFPKEALALYEEQTLAATVDAPDLREMEQLLFGYDHTEAGEFASRKLNFPDELVEIIRLHHAPEQTRANSATARLLRIVAVANQASKAMNHAFTDPADWETFLESAAWQFFVEHECPLDEQAGALVADLQAQQEHLDDYLKTMLETTPAT